MPRAISLVTLLTDFGDQDHFVASMKGVMLSINPQIQFVDLSHHITPHRIEDAAYVLQAAYRYFPEGTVHVAVVDPGVGSARRTLLVNSSRYFFLAPDNGLLTDVIQEEVGVEVRQIENKQYRLESEGGTFDGRDLFSPCAAWLTKGQQPGSYGRLVQDYVRLPSRNATIKAGVLSGRIVYVDRFGNLISNVTPYDLRELRGITKKADGDLVIRLSGLTLAGLVGCYADGEREAPRALINSHGRLEVFLKEGHAAALLKLGVGDPIELS